MCKLEEIETRAEGLDRRLYRDNGTKSVLSIQREHDHAIAGLTSSLEKISRVIMFVVSICGAGALSGGG